MAHQKHDKMLTIERLLSLRPKLSGDEIREIIWPSTIEDLADMSHYWKRRIEPLGHRKNQAEAIFAVTVKRAQPMGE